MKRVILLFVLLSGLFAIAEAGDITMRQKKALYITLHENSTLAYWDSVRVILRDSAGVAVDTVTLDTAGTGRYAGSWSPAGTGSFVAEYNAFWSGGVMCAEDYFTVLDTSAFHGAAAGLSAEEIADTLFNRGYVSGPGSGPNQVTIRTKSESDSAVIPGATVAVWNSDQTSLLGLLESDTDSGKAVFGLASGTHKLRIKAYKFQFDVPIAVGVSGNKDTTVYATEFTPSPPPSQDMVMVYGYMDSVGLAGDRAKISCTIHAQDLRVGNMLLAYHSYTKAVYTDVHGYWEMALYPNDSITPSGTIYHWVIESPYTPSLERRVEVPSGAQSWEFTW